MASGGKENGKAKPRMRRRRRKGGALERRGSASAPAAPGKQAYSASVVKNLGFDPAAKAEQKRAEDWFGAAMILNHLCMAACVGCCTIFEESYHPWPKTVPFMHYESSDLDVTPAEDNMVDLNDSDTYEWAKVLHSQHTLYTTVRDVWDNDATQIFVLHLF